MSNIPLHPSIVHFPIVLAILLPVFAVGGLWIIRRGARPLRVWAVPLAISVALLTSGFVAKQTGSREEERVERAVPENVLEAHEHAAERFVALAGVVVLVGIFGLANGLIGSAARVVATAGSLIVVFAGFQVGKAGGELVYQYNAGSVYANNAAVGAQQIDDHTTTNSEEKDED
jgi:uncharacterized membrane protein